MSSFSADRRLKADRHHFGPRNKPRAAHLTAAESPSNLFSHQWRRPVLQAPQADKRRSTASRPNRTHDLTATLPARPEIAAQPSPRQRR
jgi:hypothetical protein